MATIREAWKGELKIIKNIFIFIKNNITGICLLTITACFIVIVFYFEDATRRLRNISHEADNIRNELDGIGNNLNALYRGINVELSDIENKLNNIDYELGKMTKEIRWND